MIVAVAQHAPITYLEQVSFARVRMDIMKYQVKRNALVIKYFIIIILNFFFKKNFKKILRLKKLILFLNFINLY